MDISDYPIAAYYLDQAQTLLKRKSYLGSLLVAGALSELIAREISVDDTTRLELLLQRLLASSTLTQKQYELFDEIRRIRNRYVHINMNKLVNDFSGLALVNSGGIATFLNELVLSSTHPEIMIVKFYKLQLREDSLRVFRLLIDLIEVLY